MIKIMFIILGSLFLGIGIIGIGVPGLPSTPFFLLSAACYLRSSARLYNWLINHRIFGKTISFYMEHKAMTLRSKIIALIMVWVMIGISALFIIEIFWIRIIVLAGGALGTFVICRIKTFKK